MVKWNSICRPKVLGGLGIKKSADMNKALLAKSSWRMLQNDEGLWCKVFKNKYLKNYNILTSSYKKPTSCSSTWSGVCHGASLLRQGLVWRIGNGEYAHFWTDAWSGSGILYNKALDPSMVDNNLFVHDF